MIFEMGFLFTQKERLRPWLNNVNRKKYEIQLLPSLTSEDYRDQEWEQAGLDKLV